VVTLGIIPAPPLCYRLSSGKPAGFVTCNILVMAGEGKSTYDGASRVSAHRARLREASMKPVQMWLPDTSKAEVRSRLAHMCREIENYPGAEDDRAFIYALAEDE
jgi:hypothetical protein